MALDTPSGDGQTATLPEPAAAKPGGAALTTIETRNVQRKSRAPRLVALAIIAVGVIVGVVFLFDYWRNNTLYVSTSNAQVAGDLIQIGAVNTGRLSDVAVDVGSRVHVGEVLATVTVPSTLSVTDNGTPLLGFRGTQDAQASITSPVNGVVAQRLGNPGDTVAAGETVLLVLDPTKLWIAAEIDENKIDRVKIGQQVDVYADTLQRTLPGRVTAIDDASAASFSPLPV